MTWRPPSWPRRSRIRDSSGHVDFKFITLDDLDDRVEDGLVLWDRDGSVEARLGQRSATWPRTDPQWIEDRFWAWVDSPAVPGAARDRRGRAAH